MKKIQFREMKKSNDHYKPHIGTNYLHFCCCLDYDLQVSLMEALCRMVSPAQRNELADSWFTMTFVSSAFKKIKDSEFETVNMTSH